MDVSKSVRIQKSKFKHCEHKLIYLDTFIRKGTFHFAIQCESKQFYVGVTNEKFSTVSVGTVNDRINCIAYSPHSDKLYLGSTKGHIHCWDLLIQQQKEVPKISPVHGNPLMGLVVFHAQDQEGDHIIAFSKEGSCLYYRDLAYIRQKKFPSQFSKIAVNKSPQSENDIWAVFFFTNPAAPIIYDLVQLKNAILQDTQSLEALFDSSQKTNYDEQELSQMPKSPIAVVVSNSAAILAVADSEEVTIFTINKRGDNFFLEYDFRFKEEGIQQLDLVDASILYLSQKGIGSFNLETRTKIANNLVFKGAASYDTIQWADDGKEIIYGSMKSSSMKLLHTRLNLK